MTAATPAFIFELPAPLETLEGAIRDQLASSLWHIAEQVQPVQSMDMGLVASTCAQIRSHRVDPAVFARYQSILGEIQQQRFTGLPQLFEQIQHLSSTPASFQIVRFCEETLGEDLRHFSNIVFSEDFGKEPIGDPGEAIFKRTEAALREAFELIDAVAPEAASEVRALWSRIFVGAASGEENARRFAGVTSFLLWGSSFVNTDAYQNRIDCTEYLIHESTHALLFALSAAEPLVLNKLSERYPSPLRSDPRPMDGIYHATLVCGRLIAFFRMARISPLLKDSDRTKLEQKLSSSEQAFANGVKTVRESAILNDAGRSLLDAVEAAVQTSE